GGDKGQACSGPRFSDGKASLIELARVEFLLLNDVGERGREAASARVRAMRSVNCPDESENAPSRRLAAPPLTELQGNPVVHAPLENLERQRAAAEDDVVECADVEPVAERRARALAKL